MNAMITVMLTTAVHGTRIVRYLKQVTLTAVPRRGEIVRVSVLQAEMPVREVVHQVDRFPVVRLVDVVEPGCSFPADLVAVAVPGAGEALEADGWDVRDVRG